MPVHIACFFVEDNKTVARPQQKLVLTVQVPDTEYLYRLFFRQVVIGEIISDDVVSG